MTRTWFRPVILVVSLVPLTFAAGAAARGSAGARDGDRIAVADPVGGAVTHDPAPRLCETKRAANTPVRGAGPTGVRPALANPASGDVVKFRRLSVKDPGADNMEAVSLLIPAGWKAEGGIQWFPNHLVLANLLIKITDPRTGAAIEFLPSQHFGWSLHPAMARPQGSVYLGVVQWPPIQDPAEFVRTMYLPDALRRLQGARALGTEDFPKVAAELSRYHGSEARYARVRYEYQDGGKAWEEDVYVTLVHSPGQTGSFWSGSAHSFRAPRGQLGRLTPVMNTSVSTLRRSPEWFGYYMYVRQLFLNRMAQGIRNAGRISDAVSRNSAEIQKMYEDSYRRANESQDRISRSYGESIRGVETYRDPYQDRPIQLPSGYDGVWANRSGEYVLSNQPGFDPNAGSTAEWRRIERSP